MTAPLISETVKRAWIEAGLAGQMGEEDLVDTHCDRGRVAGRGLVLLDGGVTVQSAISLAIAASTETRRSSSN